LQEEEEEAMAKILRLRKQQRLFRSQAKDMLRQGLKTMDELDEAEEKERKEVEAKEPAPSTTNPSTYGVDSPNLFSSLSPSF